MKNWYVDELKEVHHTYESHLHKHLGFEVVGNHWTQKGRTKTLYDSEAHYEITEREIKHHAHQHLSTTAKVLTGSFCKGKNEKWGLSKPHQGRLWQSHTLEFHTHCSVANVLQYKSDRFWVLPRPGIGKAHFQMSLDGSWKSSLESVSGPSPYELGLCSAALIFNHHKQKYLLLHSLPPWFLCFGVSQLWIETVGKWNLSSFIMSVGCYVQQFKNWLLQKIYRRNEVINVTMPDCVV